MRVERDAFGNPVPSPAKEARKTRKRIRRRLRRDQGRVIRHANHVEVLYREISGEPWSSWGGNTTAGPS